MDVGVVDEPQVEVVEQGAPTDHAEATRSMAHLFRFSKYVHSGAGAEECEQRETGRCKDTEHFHAWICLPNSIQNADIQDKQRAAKARRKRAMKDTTTDACAILEDELDTLMGGEREEILDLLAGKEQFKKLRELIFDIRDGDERFATYLQDAEEYKRLGELPEEERGEEYDQLHKLMSEFTEEVDKRSEAEKQRELEHLRSLPEERIRELLHETRVESESEEYATRTYYLWMAFVCTRKTGKPDVQSERYFKTMDDFRNASPEAIDAIDAAVRDLEGRFVRGDAAGN